MTTQITEKSTPASITVDELRLGCQKTLIFLMFTDSFEPCLSLKYFPYSNKFVIVNGACSDPQPHPLFSNISRFWYQKLIHIKKAFYV